MAGPALHDDKSIKREDSPEIVEIPRPISRNSPSGVQEGTSGSGAGKRRSTIVQQPRNMSVWLYVSEGGTDRYFSIDRLHNVVRNGLLRRFDDCCAGVSKANYYRQVCASPGKFIDRPSAYTITCQRASS